MYLKIDHLFFKKIIILFWTVWWVIALWTDIVGCAAHFGYLKASWAPDINYPSLQDALRMYNTPNWLVSFLFYSIIFWSFISTVAFCRASLYLHKPKQKWLPLASQAFIISIAFWLAFFLADQITMKFDLEQNHMVQGGFELLTYLSLYLLPEKE